MDIGKTLSSVIVDLNRISASGNLISIQSGLLYILSADGPPKTNYCPIDDNLSLVREIATTLDIPIVRYRDCSTGFYKNSDGKRIPGITLQFEDISMGETIYSVFNVLLTRVRTTKYGEKGAPLPKGQFRLKKNYALYKLWLKTPFDEPRHTSAFDESMFQLEQLLFTYQKINSSRIVASTLAPLSLSSAKIKAAFQEYSPSLTHHQLVTNSSLTCHQFVTNSSLTPVTKETTTDRSQHGLQADSSTSAICHGKTETRNQGNTGTREHGKGPPPLEPILTETERVQRQTTEEWLAEYNSKEG